MLAETEDIRAISYDEVSGTVTISGAFDPLLLPCKLRRKAGWLIRDIQLVAAELRLTPQRPAMLPNPSGVLAALAPACCCGICGCGGYSATAAATVVARRARSSTTHRRATTGSFRWGSTQRSPATARRRRLLRARSCHVFATWFTLTRVVTLVLNWNGAMWKAGLVT